MKRVVGGIIGALLASLACGCALSGEPARPDSGPVIHLERVPYKLGTGDQVKVIVFGEADLSGTFQITPQGTIAYPLIGEIGAAGLTLETLTTSLTQRLSAGYVRQPRVSIEVLNYRPFYILGEVNQPGTFPFSSELTVMNAVATAGGFSYRADSKRVFIKHPSESGETEYALTSVTPVLPGDTIRIPERRF
jgi:polysaccharide export outer membrane protein